MISAFTCLACGRPDVPNLQAHVRLQLGDNQDASNNYTFGDVRGLTFGKDNQILVVDSRTGSLSGFDFTDGHLQFRIDSIGISGFSKSGLCCVAVDKEGTLWAREFNTRSYIAFKVDGSALTPRTNIQGGRNPYGAPVRVSWDSGGKIFDYVTSVPDFHKPAILISSLIDSTGRIARSDTVPTFPAESLTDYFFIDHSRSDSVTATYKMPFGSTGLWAVGPNGQVATALTSRYDVQWMKVGGEDVEHVYQTPPKVKLSRGERDRAEQMLKSIARRIKLSRAQLDFIVPNEKPPLVALGFDLDGRLWVERSTRDGSPHVADIYQRGGSKIATAEWPRDIDLNLWAVRGTSALGVKRNKSGSKIVVIELKS
ncbi:MAG: hypothetical protein ABJB66_07230 [Gemmatimonadaceae bacterium]